MGTTSRTLDNNPKKTKIWPWDLSSLDITYPNEPGGILINKLKENEPIPTISFEVILEATSKGIVLL